MSSAPTTTSSRAHSGSRRWAASADRLAPNIPRTPACDVRLFTLTNQAGSPVASCGSVSWFGRPARRRRMFRDPGLDGVVADRVAERLEPRQVGQRAGVGRLLQQRLQELLLVAHPGEVALGELLALAHVVQRLVAVDVVQTLVEVPERRVDRGDVLLDVQVDTAQGVGHLLEPAEVDQDDVVHPYTRELLHGLHRER